MPRERAITRTVKGARYSVLCVDVKTHQSYVEEVKLGQRNLPNKVVMRKVLSYLPQDVKPVTVLSSITFTEKVKMPEDVYLSMAEVVETLD